MILLLSHSPSVKSVAGNDSSPGGCREGEIPMEQFRKLSSVFLDINIPYMSCYAKKNYIIKLWEVVEMDEYKVEFFIASDDEQDVKLSSLSKKDMEHWKRELEEQALFEYYKRRIKIQSKKIWFQKAALIQ